VNLTSVVENGTYPYTYLWDFGDDNTSTDVKPSHTYTTTGIYLAHLTVTDFASRTAASSEITITVVSGSEMVVGISSDVDSGTTPLSVSFSAEILKGTPEYAYYWSFGDGSNSTLASPTHVFNQTGRFNVTLAVVDANGNVSISNPVSITVSAPSEGLPAWAWIWAGTGISILVVGAVAFVLLWTRKE
jgi:immune inhibitor A